MLVPSKEWQGGSDVPTLCRSILAKTLGDESKYQIGLTKIFFRAGMLSLLETLRTQRIAELVTLVQKNVRRHIAYKEYQRLRKATILLQTRWRGKMARRQVEDMRRSAAATKIQTAARGWLARRRYVAMQQAVVKIQACRWIASILRDLR